MVTLVFGISGGCHLSNIVNKKELKDLDHTEKYTKNGVIVTFLKKPQNLTIDYCGKILEPGMIKEIDEIEISTREFFKEDTKKIKKKRIGIMNIYYKKIWKYRVRVIQ